ncbi:MAG TPA: LamG-like jellyroll fold domain-containing protein, partial [Blastocatellia bacterium]|nr:LamG-like jellyroll fold domain-containing protein [Blastocatellia bacterium]
LLDPGPAGAFDQNGFSRPRPVLENGQWMVMLSAKNETEMGGPWCVTYASGASLNSLARSGIVLVDKGQGPAQDLTASLSGRIVSVASTAGFVADGYVQFNQDTSSDNFGQSRIRKVVDATTLELYHGLDGFTTSTPAKIVQADSASRIEIADIRQFGNKWHMYVTLFGFFGAFPNLNAFGELNGVLVADSLTGPYQWSHLATPVFTNGSWKNERSNENITFVHTPIGNAPPDPDPDPDPDNTPPQASISFPVDGATLSGAITVTADATDDVGIVGVQFKLNGNSLGPEDTTAPYAVAWDTTQFPNGSYTLTCVARDAAGNTGDSSSVTCTVSNNYALRFDGVNDMAVGPTLSPPAQISVSAWINPASLGENNSGHIFAVRDDTDNNPNLQLRLLSGNKIRLLVVFDNAGALTSGQWDTPSNSVALNTLQHIAVIYDGSSAANDPIIYINGVQQPLVRGSSPVGVMRTDAAPWRIGNNPATSATFKGIIDEMRIYDRLLLASEVAALYNNGQIIPGQPETGLIAAWHFDEGTGTVAFDYSGNGNHAALVNGPLWVIH